VGSESGEWAVSSGKWKERRKKRGESSEWRSKQHAIQQRVVDSISRLKEKNEGKAARDSEMPKRSMDSCGRGLEGLKSGLGVAYGDWKRRGDWGMGRYVCVCVCVCVSG